MRIHHTTHDRTASAAGHPGGVVLLATSAAERCVDRTARRGIVLGAWRALCAVENARRILEEVSGSVEGADAWNEVDEAVQGVARARRALRVLCELDHEHSGEGEAVGTRTSA